MRSLCILIHLKNKYMYSYSLKNDLFLAVLNCDNLKKQKN